MKDETLSVRLDRFTSEAITLLANRYKDQNVSKVVRDILREYIQRKNSGIISAVISNYVANVNYTHSITVAMIRSQETSANEKFALYKKSMSDGERMVKAYFSSLSRHFAERGKRTPALGVAEWKDKNNRRTFLHYHCLVSIDDNQEERLKRKTLEFWENIGLRYFGAPIQVHVDRLHNKEAALTYALKSIDGDYPIDRIILSE